jgi:hypothetical protein
MLVDVDLEPPVVAALYHAVAERRAVAERAQRLLSLHRSPPRQTSPGG